jgi:hypothetical protein
MVLLLLGHLYPQVHGDPGSYSDQDAANHDDNTPGSHGGPGVRLVKLKLSGTRRINPAQTPARTVVFESLLRGSGG